VNRTISEPMADPRRDELHPLPHGRDGGFLTYFFGNPAHGNMNASPEPSNGPTRAPSPSRLPVTEDALERQSSKSDDIVVM
jgi:hypothetical protein